MNDLYGGDILIRSELVKELTNRAVRVGQINSVTYDGAAERLMANEPSEQQAALLRRVAAGERINDLVDRANVIEEVESVGREQLHRVESLLVQALVRMLKAAGWPASRVTDQVLPVSSHT
ncbi:MAG: DUF29 family protein [Acetobacteraceae bacterium]